MTLRTSYVRPLWRGALDRWHGKRARWARPYITTHTPALRSAHIALEARSRRAGLWDARTHHKLLYGSRAIGAAAAPAGFHLRRGGGRPRRRAHARAYPLILTDLRGWDRPDFRPRQSYVMLSCPILWFSHHCGRLIDADQWITCAAVVCEPGAAMPCHRRPGQHARSAVLGTAHRRLQIKFA